MADETIFKIKIATVTSLIGVLLSVIVTILLFWTGSISSKVSEHNVDIATLKECVKQMVDTDSVIKRDISRIAEIVTEIRIEQAKHYGVSLDNNKKINKGNKTMENRSDIERYNAGR